MTRNLFRNTLILLAVVFFLMAGQASAEKTFTFPNGISFSYPSEYQTYEAIYDGLGSYSVIKQPGHRVMLTLIKALPWGEATAMTFIVTFRENQDELAEVIRSHEEFKEGFKVGNKTIVQKKITVADKEAFLTEVYVADDNGVDNDYIRWLRVPLPGNNIVIVYSTARGKDKFDACRAIAQSIENSLKF